jgi:hypothetical protein
LRDTQVLPIWEGTTNVLALDLLLRADVARGVGALGRRVETAVATVPAQSPLAPAVAAVRRGVRAAEGWLRATADPEQRQAEARRFALTLGRTLELALLIEHASAERSASYRAELEDLTRRFNRSGIDLLAGPRD